MTRLRGCLLGLADDGCMLLDALRADPRIELVAVADRDGDRAEQAAGAAGATRFDDYRHAIAASVTAGVEVVFVALAVYEAQEYLRLAADRSMAAFVVPPFARDFETTTELAGLFEQARRPLCVARTWWHEPIYEPLHRLEEVAGRVFAVHAHVTRSVGDALDWRADAQRAGGGALLNGGYEIIDAVVTLMGVPDTVLAAPGWATSPGQARSYDTEDAVAIALRYADDRGAAVTCRRSAGCDGWSLTLFGSQATVHVTPKSLTVTGEDGHPIADQVVETCNRYAPAVAGFATALAAGAAEPPSPVADHLGTMATIQAAYLSAKTGEAESPHRLLELAGSPRR